MTTAPAAGAEDNGVLELRWQAAAGCPARAEVAAAIAQLVDGPAAPARGTARPVVSVAIARAPSGRFVARIETLSSGQRGERELEGADCRRVVDAVVLIVAMTVDPISVVERVQPAGTTEAPLRVSIAVRGALDAGSLPDPSAGGGFAFGLFLTRFHLHAEALAWIPRLALRGPVPGSGGEIGLYTVALRGCYDLLRDPGGELRVGSCLGGELGRSTGRGLNISHPARSSGLWSAVTLAVTARHVARSGFSFALSGEGGAAGHRPTYHIENYGEVFRAAPVFARLALEAGWLFP